MKNVLKLIEGVQKQNKEDKGRVVTSVNLTADQYAFIKQYNISLTALTKSVLDDLIKKVKELES